MDSTGLAAMFAALAENPARIAEMERVVGSVRAEVEVIKSSLPSLFKTISEASKIFKVSVPTIRWWVKGGVVPTVTVENTERIDFFRLGGVDARKIARKALEECQLPYLHAVIEMLKWEGDTAAVAYRKGSGSLQRFLPALTAWELGICEALAAPAVVRSVRLCTDCGAGSPVTVPTMLGQRIFAACARADAVVARGAGPPRRLSP
jgi:hypothetical protein